MQKITAYLQQVFYKKKKVKLLLLRFFTYMQVRKYCGLVVSISSLVRSLRPIWTKFKGVFSYFLRMWESHNRVPRYLLTPLVD